MAAILPQTEKGLLVDFVPGVPWGSVMYSWRHYAQLGKTVELGKTGNWRKGLRMADHRRIACALADGRYATIDAKTVTLLQRGKSYFDKFTTVDQYKHFRLKRCCLTALRGHVVPLWNAIGGQSCSPMVRVPGWYAVVGVPCWNAGWLVCYGYLAAVGDD